MPREDLVDIDEHQLTDAPAEWGDLVGGGAFGLHSSPGWQQARAGLSGAEESVCVARSAAGEPRGGGVRAVASVFRFPRGPENSAIHPAALFDGAVDAGDPRARRWEPVTIVGSVTGHVTSPVGDLEPWLTAACRGGRVGDPAAEGTAVIEYLPDDVAARVHALLPEAALLLTSIRVVVPIHGSDLDTHYAQADRKQRELMRREGRKLSAGDRVITAEPLSQDLIDVLADLQAMTQRRHAAFGDARFFGGLYRRLSRSCLADTLLALVCRHEGRPIGYAFGMTHGESLSLHAIGLDYARVGAHAEYFNLLVHEPVRFCVENGLRELDLGIAGYEQKVLRGGQPVLLWSLLLRPPGDWTEADTRAHNRSRAASLTEELGRAKPAGVSSALARIATTGAPVWA